jgi:predicted NAD/FAD-binding protein
MSQNVEKRSLIVIRAGVTGLSAAIMSLQQEEIHMTDYSTHTRKERSVFLKKDFISE